MLKGIGSCLSQDRTNGYISRLPVDLVMVSGEMENTSRGFSDGQRKDGEACPRFW